MAHTTVDSSKIKLHGPLSLNQCTPVADHAIYNVIIATTKCTSMDLDMHIEAHKTEIWKHVQIAVISIIWLAD